MMRLLPFTRPLGVGGTVRAVEDTRILSESQMKCEWETCRKCNMSEDLKKING